MSHSVHDPVGDGLAAKVAKAQARHRSFVDRWNQRGQLLFDPIQHEAQLALEGGFDNSQENFDRTIEGLRLELTAAQKALSDHIMQQAGVQQPAENPAQLRIA